MGELLRKFTYPRNAFAKTDVESSYKAFKLLERAGSGLLRVGSDGSVKDEAFNDSRAFLATVAGPPNSPYVTPVGDKFRDLYGQSAVGAWRWLLTRSMWLYSIPNGTNASCNKVAQELSANFNLFDLVMRLLVHFSSLPTPQNRLYFDELLPILDSDANWVASSVHLFNQVVEQREQGLVKPGQHAELLSELEPHFGVPRDQTNTMFRKGFGQTGLVTLIEEGNRLFGMTLNPATYDNRILAARLRFILDNPRLYEAKAER